MARAHLSKYLTASGPRWRVRYRLAGRGPLRSAGSFASRREALLRLRFVLDELAGGRVPALGFSDHRKTPTVAAVAERWLATRVDVAATTVDSYRKHLRRLLPAFGALEVSQVTPDLLQAWIAAEAALAPATVRRYLLTLRLVLDHAGADPNPARLVRLPRMESRPVDPPGGNAFAAMVGAAAPKLRLALELLEATALRVSELCALTWGDLDSRGGRFRVRTGKSRAARRWVQLPADILHRLEDVVPREDRTPERPVFIELTPGGIRNGMTRACRIAGVPHITPHDLRRRRLSVWHAEGVPGVVISQRAGHARVSMTLDTYTGVILDDD